MTRTDPVSVQERDLDEALEDNVTTSEPRAPQRTDPFKPLRSFGDRYLAFWEECRASLERLSAIELAELDRAAHSVTQTNIGWTHYEAAKVLRELIPDERRRRAR